VRHSWLCLIFLVLTFFLVFFASFSVVRSFCVRRGERFTTKPKSLATELTQEMIVSGEWCALRCCLVSLCVLTSARGREEAEFKPFNFEALGKPLVHGALHPLLKMRAQFREIFLGAHARRLLRRRVCGGGLMAAQRWASRRCRPTGLWSRASGTLTRCSSRSSTRPATRTTPSSCARLSLSFI
jgi:hypothetical protein